MVYRRLLENALEGTPIKTPLLEEVNSLPETLWVQITNAGVNEALEAAQNPAPAEPSEPSIIEETQPVSSEAEAVTPEAAPLEALDPATAITPVPPEPVEAPEDLQAY
ncbi:hypothetical protein D3C87_1913960 [compost metagenome]